MSLANEKDPCVLRDVSRVSGVLELSKVEACAWEDGVFTWGSMEHKKVCDGDDTVGSRREGKRCSILAWKERVWSFGFQGKMVIDVKEGTKGALVMCTLKLLSI